MAITFINRITGATNNLVYLKTSDSLAVATATGYLTAQASVINTLTEGGWTWEPDDLIILNASDGIWFVTINSTFTTLTQNLINQLLQYATVPITLAEFLGMYAAPKLLVAAPGANKLIVVDQMEIVQTYGSAALANGGVVAAQWDATVHGGGVLATNSEAAADFFQTASTSYLFEGISGNTVGIIPFATSVNKGLYLSNATGAFTGGTASTFVAKVHYRIIATA